MSWRGAPTLADAQGGRRSGAPPGLGADARTVAFWTLASRVTGFVRVSALAAVLGPTFFGNLFQTVLLVPFVLGELIARSQIPSLLAPALVQAMERNQRDSAVRVARGFLGVVVAAFSVIALISVAAAPLLLWLVTLSVTDAAVRSQQIALGLPLLLMVAPQIVLFGISGVGIAVQHAHRRFAFASAAPVIENLGTILAAGVTATYFGVGLDLNRVGWGELLTLGVGSTLSVALHAAAQWWGAWRLGFRLVPSAGWRDGGVRLIVRRMVTASGSAGLASLRLLAMMVAAGQVPGGAVAFQIGQNLFNLPSALGASPIAYAQLPRLARYFGQSALSDFQATFLRSLRLALFVALPACFLFLGMPRLLAGAVSFGDMGDASAIALVAAVIAGMGVGIIGEVTFVVSASASYAKLDAGSPLRGMLIQMAVAVVGIPIALSAGTAAAELFCLGLTYSFGLLIAGAYLARRVYGRPRVPRRGWIWLPANAAAAGLACVPAVLIGWAFEPALTTFRERLPAAGALVLISCLLYLAIQFARRSEECRYLFAFSREPLTQRPDPARAAVTADAESLVR